MKTWKIIASNVLSGCVGAALVLGTAQAQRANIDSGVYRELEIRKLNFVDENNELCGNISADSGQVKLYFNSGPSRLSLEASKKDGATLSLMSEGNSARLSTDSSIAGLNLRSPNFLASLNATEKDSNIGLGRLAETPGGAIFAKASDKKAILFVAGTESRLSVYDDSGEKQGSLLWKSGQKAAVLDLKPEAPFRPK